EWRRRLRQLASARFPRTIRVAQTSRSRHTPTARWPRRRTCRCIVQRRFAGHPLDAAAALRGDGQDLGGNVDAFVRLAVIYAGRGLHIELLRRRSVVVNSLIGPLDARAAR